MGQILSHLPVGQALETPSIRSRSLLNVAALEVENGTKDHDAEEVDDEVSFPINGGKFAHNYP